jgi:hypothetical protein
MRTKSLFLLGNVMAILATCVILSSCDREFDAPGDYVDPNLTPTKTIAALKAAHVAGQVETLGDDIIAGIVVADDKSGNFYKQICIQDASGGITVRLDGLNLYANYPVGRKIYIKTKGLYMGDYAGLIQLGGSIDNSDPSFLNVSPIASNLFDTYIVKGSVNNTVTPTVVSSVAALNDSHQSMLIQLNNFEFVPADTSKTYANAATQAAANLNVKGCTGSNIIIRTSGFAKFAGVNVPNGNGTLLSIYTRFNSTKQLVIRDTSDVQFTGARCGAGPVGPTTPKTIAEIRAMYTGSDIELGDYTVGGTVISDIANGNISAGNMVLQSGNKGVLVYVGGTLTYNVGDSIVLTLSKDDSLIKYANSLEIKTRFGFAGHTRVATGKVVTPVEKTAAQINTTLGLPLGDANNFEFTLVKILNAVASPAGTYGGNKTLTDASGNITMFTRTGTSGASFMNTTMPTVSSNWVGYASNFNTTKQFSIRNTTDVTTGSGPGPGPGTGSGIDLTTSPLTINFDNIASGLPAGVKGYTGATATALGTEATVTTAATLWNNTAGAFKNFASATGLTGAADATAQGAATNRAFGLRQTGSFGDPGGAFVFQLSNTTGKSNLQLDFQLQQLDNSASGRTATFIVDYGIGDAPATFTPVTTTPAALSTVLGTFSNTAVHVNLPAAVANQSGKVWIRVWATPASTGSGSRPSTAIDDFKITWN